MRIPPIDPNLQGNLYEQVANRIEHLIRSGTLAPGERIPSVRGLSGQLSVSISTVLEAYRVLEDRRLVEARPQSGYYVRWNPEPPPPLETSPVCCGVSEPDLSDLVLDFLKEVGQPGIVPFGAAVPHPSFLPTEKLNRILARVVRRNPECSQSYDSVQGLAALRTQIARRALEAGCALRPDDIVTTCGAAEAVHLCLRAVTRPGDAVVVESPTYYGLLEALESLQLRALEIATCPSDGICLEDLAQALQRQRVAACVLIPSFNNPLGHCMPDEKRRRLLALLMERGIPLIEDDVYGDLYFEETRPHCIKSLDTEGKVLLCSSFSKTLAPGYRVGWTAPGVYRKEVERLKFCSSVATATPTQMAVAEFLRSGGYDRHLRKLRTTYRDLVERMTASIAECFPGGTRISRPRGGHVLWVELPASVDSLRLHEDALRAGISVGPGPLFSASGRYRNFLRLNCAVPWSERVEQAIHTLGSLVAA